MQLYDSADPMKARTAVREYMQPGLLFTNRETANEAFWINDETLPFEARIKGVFTGWLQRAK